MWPFFYNVLARRIGYLDTPDVVRREPADLLASLVHYAVAHVPWYAQYDPTAPYATFPILTKDDIRTHRDELISTTVRRGEGTYARGTYWNTSGGSTGEPVRLLQDITYLRSARRATHEQERWTGYRLGDRLVKLWGDERELFTGSFSLQTRLRNRIKRQLVLNAFRMTPTQMRSYIDQINTFQPRLVIAYAQAMYELCVFAEEHQLRITGARAVMTSAGTLYPFMRDVIERVCGVRVFNRYGSREVGNIAAECELHDGLHIADQHVFVEIVDDAGAPCPPGIPGRVLVTTLTNRAMPLLRYEIGDYAARSVRPCDCGRPEPMLKQVVGRVTDAFRTAAGKVVPAEYFIHVLGVVSNRGAVRKFQVRQRAVDDVLVLVVVTDTYTAADTEEIKRMVRRGMEADCTVTVQRVDAIPPLPSGKYRYTISDVPVVSTTPTPLATH